MSTDEFSFATAWIVCSMIIFSEGAVAYAVVPHLLDALYTKEYAG
jgi:hypothetical protein